MKFKSIGVTPLPKMVASPNQKSSMLSPVKKSAPSKPKAPPRPLPNMGLVPLPKMVASPKKSKMVMKKKKKG